MIENLYLGLDFRVIESVLQLAILGFSLFLLGLTIKAYAVSGLKKILFAAGAFGLFSVNLFFEYAEEAFGWFEDSESELISTFIFLIILILFFIAIVKKK